MLQPRSSDSCRVRHGGMLGRALRRRRLLRRHGSCPPGAPCSAGITPMPSLPRPTCSLAAPMTAGMYANAPSLLRGLVVRVKRKVGGGAPPALQAGWGVSCSAVP